MSIQVDKLLPGHVPRMEGDAIGLGVGTWHDTAFEADAEDDEASAAGDKATTILLAELPPQHDRSAVGPTAGSP
jgi:hypothetical protein